MYLLISQKIINSKTFYHIIICIRFLINGENNFLTSGNRLAPVRILFRGKRKWRNKVEEFTLTFNRLGQGETSQNPVEVSTGFAILISTHLDRGVTVTGRYCMHRAK